MVNDRTEVREQLQELTLEEKIRLVHGAADPEGLATGYLPGVERLGIPEFRLTDGPMGVRAHGKPATAFPSSIALAATFDPELARRQGAAMGQETKSRGQDALLGPGVNLIRVPHCGRNFEYYAEDPVLTAAFAAAMVDGIQSEDIVATPKHYVANNQETKRASVNVDVSETALRECYLPGFKAAVDAGAGSVMSGYNGVNGEPMSEKRRLLMDVLKEEWGFEGYVVSDWFGTKSTVGSTNAGLDLEMPGIDRDEMWEAFGIESDGGSDAVFGENTDVSDGMPDPSNTGLFAEPLFDAVKEGDVPESRIDDMVSRILRQMKRVGLFEDDRSEDIREDTEHGGLSETIATRGTVLLQNDGILPLADDTSIAVVGPSVHEAKSGGGGSSEIEPLDEVPTADGIRERATGDVSVARGVPEVEQVSFFGGGDENENGGSSEPRLEDAIDVASTADVAVVVVQDAAAEALDRDSLRLPGKQDELIEAVAGVNDRTVVVVQSSGPVELPWQDDVSAVVENWYPGQSDGDALAAVLFGDVDPSGRLPVTFANESDYPTADPSTFPGTDGTVQYAEDLFIGYRHFDANDIEPIYPFGHGLSYATFSYHSIEVVEERQIRITLENTSNRDGNEVVQIYARSEKSDGVNRPVQELAGFSSVAIPANETMTVDIDLDLLPFERYDETNGWMPLEGQFELVVGRSARDIRLVTELYSE
ncbi:beta-glucosidase family protein [Halococcus hamelinensis]|uniref:Beta-glucosidase n=1 Tax=Halococcus hamelinensis 100A6 TaxID=1132509 RepID=M0LYJ4_9EURY|nr:glycoside hydrolase family 3 C-terminal domain-containing protein [Halococcus hamelinensis]EMA37180.1 Beta-glucosidase [Halococcus hamelinensis 100A6]